MPQAGQVSAGAAPGGNWYAHLGQVLYTGGLPGDSLSILTGMPLDRRTVWWVPGFLASFFAVGLTFWFRSYSEVQFPTALMNPSLLVVAVAALLTRIYSGRNFALVALCIAAAIPMAIYARVTVDTASDPTSHNLWPLEILIGAFVAFPVALAGAFIGWLVARFRGARAEQEPS